MEHVVEILKLVTTKHVAMSTTIVANEEMLRNIKKVNEDILADLLLKIPNNLHETVALSFLSCKRTRALNSIKTVGDVLKILKNDLCWIPPIKHVLDEEGREVTDPCEEGEIFYYVPIIETLKAIHKDASFKKSASLGNNVILVDLYFITFFCKYSKILSFFFLLQLHGISSERP